ncbi:arrestin family protein [Rhodotorula paludigena]|uniref:arrestin family protein n=1 Tax=Rhodotorula paludigena TaxID=86838 RepID=UPI0031771635
MSSNASIRLTEPVVFLVGGLDYERARQRQRRAAARAAAAETTTATAASTAQASVGTPGPSRPASPDRAARSRSRPGSRTASPAPASRGRGEGGDQQQQQQAQPFIPPNSRGRSHSRTRAPTPSGRGDSISRGREGSLVREMTEAQLALQAEMDQAALDEPPPALLRGLLTVHLSKPTRVKEISVRFKGSARTDWPEGIGPRRLDVMEETPLINVTHTFFSAATAPMQRRAASIGPGTREHGDEERGRSSRRAASVVPGRQFSQGPSYARDALLTPLSIPAHAADASQAPGLSRIASEEDLHNQGVPPIQPGELAPAYEVAVPTAPNSPLHGPISHNNSIDHLDLGTPLHHAALSSRRFERSPTPSRSPLGTNHPITSPVESPMASQLSLQRTSTRTSRLSHDSHDTISSHSSNGTDRPTLDRQISSSNSTAASLSSDPDQLGTGWNSAPVPGSTTSSFERGRPPVRDPSRGSAGSGSAGSAGHDQPGSLDTVVHGVAGMTFQPRASSSRASISPSPIGAGSLTSERRRRASSASSNQTARRSSTADRPSILKSSSGGSSGRSGSTSGAGRSGSSSAAGRSVSRGARFALSGISEVFRGKSSSRARQPAHAADSDAVAAVRAGSPSRRPASPDGVRAAGGARVRSQSRGRKTALKALRDALIVGHSHHHGDGGSDEDKHGGGSGGSGEAHHGDGWKEFKAGTYTYPISITVPASLPPTLNCEFGHVSYALKATVHRAGALTSKLTASTEVTLVTTPGEEDTEESESIVVERFWETQVKYHVALSGKSFPIGGQIPISIRLHPLAKIKLYRITAQLEQKTSYFASAHSGRKLTRHETPKRFQLLRIENKDPKEPLLPILSDDPDVLSTHPLKDFFINATSSDDSTPSLLDPIGPWCMDGILQLPDCSSKLAVSTNHEKSNISITHTLKIMMRVERGDDEYLDSKGNRKLWDIVVEAGAVMLSCRLAQNVLPAYTDATASVSGPSGSGSSNSRSSRNAPRSTHECGAHGPAPSSRPSNIPLGLGAGSTHRQNAGTAAPVATLEQTLLLARLIAGETTPAGETPPAYAAVVDGTAPQGRGRTETVAAVGEEEERGRSSSTRRAPRD